MLIRVLSPDIARETLLLIFDQQIIMHVSKHTAF